MIVLLALGDFVWSVSAITSSALLLAESDLHTSVACVGLRGMFQFGAWSSLTWSLGILVFMIVTLVLGEGDKARRRQWKIALWVLLALVAYGWQGAALAIELSNGLIVQRSSRYHCNLLPPWNLYLWFVPLMCLFCLGWLLVFFVLFLYRRRLGLRPSSRAPSSRLSIPLRTALFPLMMLLTWVLNLVAELMPPPSPYPLVVANVVLLNAQGMWDSVIYGLTNGRFRDFFRRRVGRTLLLFAGGPVLVVPLLLRRLYLYAALRCCPARQPYLYTPSSRLTASLSSSTDSMSSFFDLPQHPNSANIQEQQQQPYHQQQHHHERRQEDETLPDARAEGLLFPLPRTSRENVTMPGGIVASFPASVKAETPILSVPKMVDASAFLAQASDDDQGDDK